MRSKAFKFEALLLYLVFLPHSMGLIVAWGWCAFKGPVGWSNVSISASHAPAGIVQTHRVVTNVLPWIHFYNSSYLDQTSWNSILKSYLGTKGNFPIIIKRRQRVYKEINVKRWRCHRGFWGYLGAGCWLILRPLGCGGVTSRTAFKRAWYWRI